MSSIDIQAARILVTRWREQADKAPEVPEAEAAAAGIRYCADQLDGLINAAVVSDEEDDDQA